jgi:hypothetical protein
VRPAPDCRSSRSVICPCVDDQVVERLTECRLLDGDTGNDAIGEAGAGFFAKERSEINRDACVLKGEAGSAREFGNETIARSEVEGSPDHPFNQGDWQETWIYLAGGHYGSPCGISGSNRDDNI